MARSVYARIADLRAILTDESAFPDDVLWGLLELASAMVEHYTQQFFGPRYIDTYVDGLGKRAIQEAAQNKVIEVERLEYRRTDGSFRLIDPKFYSITDSERRIRLRTIDKLPSPPDRAFLAGSQVDGLTIDRVIPPGSPARRFPYDDSNVHMVGFFGWLELSEKFETVLTADLAAGGTSVTVQDSGDVETNDLLLIDRRFWVIVGAVATTSVPEDPGPAVDGVFTIDPSPKAAASGAEVIRFGQVPLLIRQAVLRTAVANQYTPGSDQEVELGLRQRIKREETDNYEIEFFSSNRSASTETGTGDPRADAILSRFRASTVSGEWA